MKSQPEMEEGPKAWKNFDSLMGKVLSVPHSEILRREKEYQKRAKANPNRRGPKKKN